MNETAEQPDTTSVFVHGNDIIDRLAADPFLRVEPQCIECVHPDEDPAPWCDCRFDETCGDHGPCRRRAHDTEYCPTPGRW